MLVELSELLQLHDDGDDRQDEEQEERVNPENVLRIQMRDAGSHTTNLDSPPLNHDRNLLAVVLLVPDVHVQDQAGYQVVGNDVRHCQGEAQGRTDRKKEAGKTGIQLMILLVKHTVY